MFTVETRSLLVFVACSLLATLPAGASDSLFDLSLDELMDLEAVVTSANRTAEEVRDVAASVVIVTREEIERYGYLSLTELLSDIPGLYVIDDYFAFGPNFGVRGYLAGDALDNMKILVDGVDQMFDVTASYTLATNPIPVAAIDRIEIIRGPTSVVYGSGSFFGVINIITNGLQQRGGGVEARLSIGERGHNEAFFRYSGKSDRFDYVFNASHTDSDGINVPYRQLAPDSTFAIRGVDPRGATDGRLTEESTFVGMNVRIDQFRFSATFGETRNPAYVFGPKAGPDGNAVRGIGNKLSAGYTDSVAPSWDLDLQLGYTNDSMNLEFFDEGGALLGVQELSSSSWALDGQLTGNLSKGLHLAVGANLRDVRQTKIYIDLFGAIPALTNTIFRVPTGDSIVTWGVFARSKLQVAPAVRFEFGLRAERTDPYDITTVSAAGTSAEATVRGRYEEDTIELLPQAAAIWSPTDEHVLKLLYGRSANRPSFFQNRLNSLDPDLRDLRPQIIETFELVYLGQVAPGLSIGANLFRNELTDLITRVARFDDDGSFLDSWSDNAGRVVTRGIELTGMMQASSNLSLNLSVTLNTSDDRESDRSVAYAPKHLAYLKLAWMPTTSISCALTANYVDGMETYFDTTLRNDSGGYGTRIGDAVGSSTVLGVNVRWSRDGPSTFWVNLRIANLLDETVRYPTTPNNPWASYGTVGWGRHALLTAGTRF